MEVSKQALQNIISDEERLLFAENIPAEYLSDALDRRAAGAFRVGAVLFSNQYGPLGQTRTAKELLDEWKNG